MRKPKLPIEWKPPFSTGSDDTEISSNYYVDDCRYQCVCAGIEENEAEVICYALNAVYKPKKAKKK